MSGAKINALTLSSLRYYHKETVSSLVTIYRSFKLTKAGGIYVRDRDDWFAALRIFRKEVVVSCHGAP